jgi:preprotein translocase subunit YajC
LKSKRAVDALTLRQQGAGDNRARLLWGNACVGRHIIQLARFSMEFLILSAAAGGAGGSAFFVQLFPLLLIFVVFYLFLIRPQQKRAKEHEAKINAVQKNDEVVTAGGLMGKVTKVADDYVEVEIAPNVRVKAVKSTIANVQSRSAKAAND